MEVGVIGSGYVGTTVAACFADLGHSVTAIDIDQDVVDRLNDGASSLYEPGLDERIERTIGRALRATTDYGAIRGADIVFIAVPTPTQPDGRIDASAVHAAVSEAVTTLEGTDPDDRPVLVIKSTITPPEVTAVRKAVTEWTGEVAMNPEFQREGSAVSDFLTPDKLVFGVESADAADLLRDVYAPIIAESDPTIIETDPETASMIKYANNAFLAAKISLVNDLGNICKTFGIDAYEVADAIGSDHRISAEFLRSGVGFGGSCFPKDVSALIAAARAASYEPTMLEATMDLNERQPIRLLSLLERHLDPAGKRIAILGLAFKPETDDVRNSRAIPVIETLLESGATVVGYDPVASQNMHELFPSIEYAEAAEAALTNADAALVLTDWPEFGELTEEFDVMARKLVIDGRRIITPQDDMTYEGLTW